MASGRCSIQPCVGAAQSAHRDAVRQVFVSSWARVPAKARLDDYGAAQTQEDAIHACWRLVSHPRHGHRQCGLCHGVRRHAAARPQFRRGITVPLSGNRIRAVSTAAGRGMTDAALNAEAANMSGAAPVGSPSSRRDRGRRRDRSTASAVTRGRGYPLFAVRPKSRERDIAVGPIGSRRTRDVAAVASLGSL